MASYERLPSGKWRAQVYHPSGRKINIPADKLRSVVKQRALEVEASIRRGDYVDERLSRLTVEKWYELCMPNRVIELATRDRIKAAWNAHVKPRWGTWPLAAVTYEECVMWIGEMSQKKNMKNPDVLLGPAMIASAASLLRYLLDEAVRGKRLAVNPMRLVRLPSMVPHEDRVFTLDEEELLYDLCDEFAAEGNGSPFWPEFRTLLQVLFGTGLRFQEVAGLKRHNVNPLRRTITVGQVLPRLDRTSTRRRAKSDAGTGRVVPITKDLADLFEVHLARHGSELVFASSRERKPINYISIRKWGWTRLRARADLMDPQPTMHDIRHTYGTRLADSGVPPHEIMALMGHSSLKSTQRYLHASERRFDRAREALEGRLWEPGFPPTSHGPSGGLRVAGHDGAE